MSFSVQIGVTPPTAEEFLADEQAGDQVQTVVAAAVTIDEAGRPIVTITQVVDANNLRRSRLLARRGQQQNGDGIENDSLAVDSGDAYDDDAHNAQLLRELEESVRRAEQNLRDFVSSPEGRGRAIRLAASGVLIDLLVTLSFEGFYSRTDCVAFHELYILRLTTYIASGEMEQDLYDTENSLFRNATVPPEALVVSNFTHTLEIQPGFFPTKSPVPPPPTPLFLTMPFVTSYISLGCLIFISVVVYYGLKMRRKHIEKQKEVLAEIERQRRKERFEREREYTRLKLEKEAKELDEMEDALMDEVVEVSHYLKYRQSKRERWLSRRGDSRVAAGVFDGTGSADAGRSGSVSPKKNDSSRSKTKQLQVIDIADSFIDLRNIRDESKESVKEGYGYHGGGSGSGRSATTPGPGGVPITQKDLEYGW